MKFIQTTCSECGEPIMVKNFLYNKTYWVIVLAGAAFIVYIGYFAAHDTEMLIKGLTKYGLTLLGVVLFSVWMTKRRKAKCPDCAGVDVEDSSFEDDPAFQKAVEKAMTPDNELKAIQKKMAENVARAGRNSGFKLDYSHESIGELEKMLGKHHEEYKQTKNEGKYQSVALECAAYIVTTMENNGIKGEWKTDHESIGPATFPFIMKEQAIFPFAWCMKRIIDGEGDNVAHKYKIMVLEKGKSLDQK